MASWSARMAELCQRRPEPYSPCSYDVTKSLAISRTRRANGSLRSSRSVDFWYLRISRSATVPGLKRRLAPTWPAQSGKGERDQHHQVEALLELIKAEDHLLMLGSVTEYSSNLRLETVDWIEGARRESMAEPPPSEELAMERSSYVTAYADSGYEISA